jgi:hypothetical protein
MESVDEKLRAIAADLNSEALASALALKAKMEEATWGGSTTLLKDGAAPPERMRFIGKSTEAKDSVMTEGGFAKA